MQKRALVFALALLLMTALATFSTAEDAERTWTGEILDVACYVAQGAAGEDHQGCAKACVKNGQPMGLLTEKGSILILAADHKSGDGFAAAKELAGQAATVTGSLAEKDGMKVLTVTAAKPAA